ncbi:MAG: YbbR-like domain-containing protein [Deltaproteobacteria bacterium]|nr:YbbR-like domain-containing protein [Deltaproteobacteria bacterium]
MRKPVTSLIAENLFLKGVSLVLAVLLFFVVRAEKQSMAQGEVKLALVLPPGKVLVADVPSVIRVGVVGAAGRLARFRFDELAEVTVDLTSVPGGYVRITEEALHLPPGIRVSSMTPEGFNVRFAPLAQRELPIEVTLAGQVATGFRVVRWVARPSRATVSGPQEVVSALGPLQTQPVSVEGADGTVVARTGWLPLPPRVAGPSPARVEVSVHVAPIMNSVTLSGVPVRVAGGAARRVALSPEVLEVTLEGSPERLATLVREEVVVSVRVSDATDGAEVVPRVVGLPEGVRVKELRPSRVKVQRRSGAAAPRRESP